MLADHTINNEEYIINCLDPDKHYCPYCEKWYNTSEMKVSSRPGIQGEVKVCPDEHRISKMIEKSGMEKIRRRIRINNKKKKIDRLQNNEC